MVVFLQPLTQGYLSLVFDTTFPLETSHKGMAMAEEPPSLSPYPYILSLLVQSLPLYQQLFHACTSSPYPSILELAFLSSISHTFFTNSSLFFLSIWPNHLKVFFFTHSTTPHHSISISIRATSFIHTCIALTFPSCPPYPRPTFLPHQLSHYFQPFHSCFQLKLSYSLFQSSSDTRSHHSRTSSSFPFSLLTFTGAYTDPCIFNSSYLPNSPLYPGSLPIPCPCFCHLLHTIPCIPSHTSLSLPIMQSITPHPFVWVSWIPMISNLPLLKHSMYPLLFPRAFRPFALTEPTLRHALSLPEQIEGLSPPIAILSSHKAGNASPVFFPEGHEPQALSKVKTIKTVLMLWSTFPLVVLLRVY